MNVLIVTFAFEIQLVMVANLFFVFEIAGI